jgi:hypothetical protein
LQWWNGLLDTLGQNDADIRILLRESIQSEHNEFGHEVIALITSKVKNAIDTARINGVRIASSLVMPEVSLF